MRVLYAGTPEFAVPALQAIVDAGHVVPAVYCQPDRRAGRGRKLSHGPVKAKALALGLTVEQPEHLKDDAVQKQLADYAADVMVVAAYGLLLPAAVLELPVHGCINIHASLLPRWRGAAPIQRAIAAGDPRSGITIMQMDAGLDTGDMLLTSECEIGANTTAAQLHDKLAELGSPGVLAVLDQIVSGCTTPMVQDKQLACYAHKIEKSEALLDWSRPALELHRKVCAFNAWPVAQTGCDGEVIRVWESEPHAAPSALPAGARAGQLLASDNALDVLTGDGILRLLTVQAAGKKPVSSADFLNSRSIATGTLLGAEQPSGSSVG